MKRTLALAAVALIAAAPLAHANDATAPAAAPAAEAPAAAAASHEVTLEDGSKVTIAADMTVWTVDATTGAKTAKADGEYKLADGTALKVEGGKAVGTPPAAPAAH